jgi:hypothetical protein
MLGMLNLLREPFRVASAAPPASPASAAPPATRGVFALLATLENVPPPLAVVLRFEVPREPPLDLLPPDLDLLPPDDERLFVDPRELERELPDLLRALAVERFPELERVFVWAILASFPGGSFPLASLATRCGLSKNRPQNGECRQLPGLRF